jgi:hypothetical protein
VNAMTGAPQSDLDAMAAYDDAQWNSHLEAHSVGYGAYDDDDRSYDGFHFHLVLFLLTIHLVKLKSKMDKKLLILLNV